VRILALDTATEACSIALQIGDTILERYVELDRGHAERLLPMVDEVLAESGLALGSLDAIAFGRGPGGFTGVRLAASVAQGLAFGAGLGVVPVSDLAAVAQRALSIHPGIAGVLTVNDARMREIYWATFSAGSRVEALGEEQVGPSSTVAIPVSSPDAATWVAAGRGLRAAPELAERCRLAGMTLLADLLPRATEVLLLAQPAVAAGKLLPPEGALPVYVRDKVVAAAV
jgi:tRNA threonylcarbamoyladenosine biosynthesis protein TsaB